MRAALVLAIVLAMGAAQPASAKPKPRKVPPKAAPAAAPQVAVVRSADGWRADLAFDGSLIGWALAREHDARRALLLLVGQAPDAGGKEAQTPCALGDAAASNERTARLFRWRSESPERLETLASDLPAGSLESADLDGDGADELLLIREGRIDLVLISTDGVAGLRALVADEDLGRSYGGPRLAWDEPAAQDASLRVSLLGAFRTYRGDPERHVTIASELAIPERVNAGSERVRVESPAVRPIGRTSAGRMVFATEPEPLGRRRLRTLLLDPDGPAETRIVESWALFPEPERVVDSSFAMLQGSPVLVVTTTSAEKLSLLGEKALRIYPLGGDRTRAGDAPLFATTTGINLWQQVYPAIVDLDRDGRDDLVLAYWKGLKNSIAALEVYRGRVDPGFAKPHTTSFDVESGEKGFLEFGADADGDGRPDLVLLANNELLVFPGAAPEKAAETPVANHPSRRIALPKDLPGAHGMSFSLGSDGFQVSRSAGGLGDPHLLDLDGDGRPEALFAGDGGSSGRAVVVFFRGASGLAPSYTISHE